MDAPIDPHNGKWGPVFADFSIERVPQGFAPQEIREEWVGLALPVRAGAIAVHVVFDFTMFVDGPTQSLIQNEDPIPIVTVDATAVLEAVGKHEAAGFWQQVPRIGPLLIFRADEGTLTARPGFDLKSLNRLLGNKFLGEFGSDLG